MKIYKIKYKTSWLMRPQIKLMEAETSIKALGYFQLCANGFDWIIIDIELIEALPHPMEVSI